MRTGKRTAAGATALLVLLGLFCPALCFADATASSSHAAESAHASPSCHEAEPPAPVDDGSAPRNEHSDCSHCESAATIASVDGSLDLPDLGIAKPWLGSAGCPRTVVGPINARSHDPPPRDLLLVKSSFLL